MNAGDVAQAPAENPFDNAIEQFNADRGAAAAR